jgi:hypothetical protein
MQAQGGAAPDLVANLLTDLLPQSQDAKLSSVMIDDSQWEEVLYDREVEREAQEAAELAATKQDVEMATDEDVLAFGDEPDPSTETKRSDWVGLERDKRSAFLIIGALRMEGMV